VACKYAFEYIIHATTNWPITSIYEFHVKVLGIFVFLSVEICFDVI